jgi:hypothetical protein
MMLLPLFSSLMARIVGAVLLCPPDVIDQGMPMVAPLPTTLRDFRTRRSINTILETCCKDDAGYEIQLSDEWIVNNGGDLTVSSRSDGDGDGNENENEDDDDDDVLKDKQDPPVLKPSTYGEVTPKGARQLFHQMGILKKQHHRQETNKNNNDENSLVFMDLGSGAGKLVIQACLELPHLRRAVGVELSPTRHQAAMTAKHRLKLLHHPVTNNNQLLPPQLHENSRPPQRDKQQQQRRRPYYDDASLQLIEDDLLNADLSDATHIYVASLCFPPKLMRQLQDKLQQEAPNLRCVASIRTFPSLPVVSRMEYVEMSWTKPKGMQVYFYDISNGMF